MTVHTIQQGWGATNPDSAVSIRCPSCKQVGVLDVFGNVNDVQLPDQTALGSRYCPNVSCRAVLSIVHRNRQVLASYPPERLDFDATNIPAAVLTSFEEAITCHANACFIAAAIMVRKTLEGLCHDRKAEGDNLKARIRVLGEKVVLPKELLDGLDDLRLLGNDAAHVESQEYNQVGKEEVEVGVEFTKEVLKAVYQYSALLQRLRGLKRQP